MCLAFMEHIHTRSAKSCHCTKYSGTSVKQPLRRVALFSCLREVAAEQRYSLTGNLEKSGELSKLAHMVGGGEIPAVCCEVTDSP